MEILGHSDIKVHRQHYTDVTENRIKKISRSRQYPDNQKIKKLQVVDFVRLKNR